MADLKISQLSSATTPLAGTEVVPLVQSGATKKVAVDDLTVKNLRSNATTGILQVAGPAAGATRTMTTPDANFTAARTDAAQTFTGDQTITGNVTAKTDSATAYPIVRTSNRTGSSSSHVVGAFAFDAYRDVADPSYVGAIWIESVNPFYQDSTIMYLACNNSGTTSLPTATVALNNNAIGKGFYPVADNDMPLGLGGNRWSVVYAGNGTINTSDANEKTDIAELDEAEKKVAVRLKSLIKKFRFNDAVAAKGDNARVHVGAIAQEVAAAFVAEGLDPNRYGVFCSDTFRTFNGKTVNVDKDNKYVEQYAVMNDQRIDVPAGEELPEGAEWKVVKHDTEEQTRLGLRYDQLFAFIISAL